jgi:hypothetical protein
MMMDGVIDPFLERVISKVPPERDLLDFLGSLGSPGIYAVSRYTKKNL